MLILLAWCGRGNIVEVMKKRLFRLQVRGSFITFANEKKIREMRIGIIVAMEKELRQLRGLMDELNIERHGKKDFIRGRIAGSEVVLVQSGIGKVNAAIGAVELINNYAPELIMSTGVAGGASTDLNPMDVVVGTRYIYHDVYCGSEVSYGQFVGMPPHFDAPKEIVGKALALRCKEKIVAGEIVSGDWFVDTKEKMAAILEKCPKAVAVDMESASIAHTCYVYRVPFVSFRIISDVPLKDTNASQYYDFWDKIAEGSFEVTRMFIEELSSLTRSEK